MMTQLVKVDDPTVCTYDELITLYEHAVDVAEAAAEASEKQVQIIVGMSQQIEELKLAHLRADVNQLAVQGAASAFVYSTVAGFMHGSYFNHPHLAIWIVAANALVWTLRRWA
jgi:hypothetical protein